MRTAPLAIAALLLAAARPSAAEIPVERVATGLAAPIFVASPPGDPRLFVVERGGTIRIWDGAQLLAPPFLDISGKVDDQGEGGLLGLAFAPDYATSRAFYVYYTADGDGVPLESRVSRFRADASEPNLANTNEKVLLRVDQPDDNHNGGTIAFGPDGYLYLGLGDGGGGGDPNDNAQDGATLLGKMLRLDVSFSVFGDEYAIPDDNPFVGPDGVLDEIWALGLRNPFRFSFDRTEGDLYIGDVGQSAQEEIDVVTLPAPASGYNFGWDVMEGTLCFDDEGQDPDPGEPPCNDPSLTLPVHTYDRLPGCNSVTGGAVYRGSRPELQGHYFFGDYCLDKVWSLVWDGGSGIIGDVVDRTAELTPDAGSVDAPVAFGEDAAGEMYIVDIGGELFRIVPEPGAPLLLVAGAAALAGLRRARR